MSATIVSVDARLEAVARLGIEGADFAPAFREGLPRRRRRSASEPGNRAAPAGRDATSSACMAGSSRLRWRNWISRHSPSERAKMPGGSNSCRRFENALDFGSADAGPRGHLLRARGDIARVVEKIEKFGCDQPLAGAEVRQRDLPADMVAKRFGACREIVEIEAFGGVARRRAGHRFPLAGEFGHVGARRRGIVLEDVLVARVEPVGEALAVIALALSGTSPPRRRRRPGAVRRLIGRPARPPRRRCSAAPSSA